MNWYKIFYWLTVADNAKTFFIALIVIFTCISVIATIGYFWNSEEFEDIKKSQTMARKWMWWSYPFAIIFWMLYIFTPDKKGALLIVAGGGAMQFLSSDTAARQIPKEALNLVVTELRSMASEAKVEIGINNQKEAILKEAQSLTPQALIERMKTDTTFKDIVLGK